MNLKEYAEKELRSIGLFDQGSDYNGMIGKSVMELIEVFSDQGHSGFSASVTLDLFQKVAKFQPLSPITCEDEEWCDAGDDTYQNKRNFSVFKEGKNGRPYFINAYIIARPDGSCWNAQLSLNDGKRIRRCYIKDFSKMPTIKINVLEEETSKDDWKTLIEDESQIEELKKYYELEIS